MAQAGDRVKIIANKSSEEGILMPSSDKNVVLLKLNNGYNVGFDQKEVSNITVLAKATTKKKTVANKKQVAAKK